MNNYTIKIDRTTRLFITKGLILILDQLIDDNWVEQYRYQCESQDHLDDCIQNEKAEMEAL